MIVILQLCLILSRVYSIPANADSAYIKQIIQFAETGDSLLFHGDYYALSNFTVNKSLTFIAKQTTTFDAQNKAKLLEVKADSFFVENLRFINVKMSFVEDNAAIKYINLKKGAVTNCHFERNFFSIYLANSEQILVSRNYIRADTLRETHSGNGIHLWNSRRITISDNEIYGHRDGIYLEFVKNCIIRNNKSIRNLRYGLHFMYSDNSDYMYNHFEGNKSGIAVMYSKNINMSYNKFLRSEGQTSFGLLFKVISESKVTYNIFERNTVAFFSDASDKNQIEHNSFINNGWAIKIVSNSMDNTIKNNNFIENIFDISTNSRANYNQFQDNYWDKYNGYDLNKDGIGDLPYRPVKFFSLIVAKQPIMLILTNSIFMNLLNLSEEAIPVLTPDKLIDHSPRLRPLK